MSGGWQLAVSGEQSAASGFAVMAQQTEPTVTEPDYSKQITIEGKRATLAECPNCGTTPHLQIANGKKVCGFCGLEH